MRILVTGAAGQVGREVVGHLLELGHHDVVAVDLPATGIGRPEAGGPVDFGPDVARGELEITARDLVLGTIASTAAEAVINCAAFTAVDACETEVELAYAANALGVRHLAEGCALVGARLVHLSTDYVFDGTKAEPYHEWDTPNPQSVYGRSKLGGEVEARTTLPDATVVRTSWVCGFHGGNMVKTILRLAAEPGGLRFVDDQRGHPTFAADLARALVRLAVEHRPGLFHVTNAGAVSWFEFARAVLEAAGDDPERVAPVATADLQQAYPAPRPANSVLDNAAWRMSGLPAQRDFREPLAEVVARLQAT